MEKTCEFLRSRVDHVAGTWRSLSEQQHWLVNGERYSTALATRMVVALVEAAVCNQKSVDAHLAKVRVAAEYAAYCRDTGVDIGTVTGKFLLLREAFWQVLNGTDELDRERRLRAIVWIDVAFSLLTRASMIGYHKGDFEARGLWPAVVDSMATESPLLGERGR